MANKNASISARASAKSVVVSWLAMGNGDVGVDRNGAPGQGYVSLPALPDRTVQVTGTFSTGGSVSIEGSNDGGTTWAILSDPLGNALTFTAAGMKQITEMPDLIRAHVDGGDGSTSLNVYLSARGEVFHG
jgi:hypothetical protein